MFYAFFLATAETAGVKLAFKKKRKKSFLVTVCAPFVMPFYEFISCYRLPAREVTFIDFFDHKREVIHAKMTNHFFVPVPYQFVG